METLQQRLNRIRKETFNKSLTTNTGFHLALTGLYFEMERFMIDVHFGIYHTSDIIPFIEGMTDIRADVLDVQENMNTSAEGLEF